MDARRADVCLAQDAQGSGRLARGWAIVRRDIRSMVKFALVGCLNTGVDFLLFTILYGLLDVDELIAQTVSYSGGIVNSFVLNKLWTFEEKKVARDDLPKLVKFVAINLLTLTTSVLLLHLLCNVVGINAYIAKVGVTPAMMALSYLLYRQIVFRRGSR